MPKVPKWLGDTMETVFSSQYTPVKVTLTENMTSGLRKVRFEGEFRKNKDFIPGMVIEFRVSETEYRHYTPSYYDADKGICEVLFYLHDKGPGSKWAASLQDGEEVKLIGPGGKIKYQPESYHHLVFGDETSLSQFYCLNQAFVKDEKKYLFIYESDSPNSQWAEKLGLKNTIVTEKSDLYPAQESIRFIQNISDNDWKQWQSASVYLTGRAKSVQAMRKALTDRGIAFKQIKTEPYWSEGKAGL